MNTASESIKDLEIPEGRLILHEFYHDRRIQVKMEIAIVLECWRLCKRGTEIQLSDGRIILIENPLGFRLGTRVCIEEIIGRYYYNSVQGWVYFGAMVLLIFVGLRLGGVIPERAALIGVGIEAFMLFLLAVVTYYSPSDDVSPSSYPLRSSDNLLSSINQSVQGMTNAVSDLFRLISQTDMRQDVLLTRLTEYISKVSAENTRLQIEKMGETNKNLRDFAETLRELQGETAREQLNKLQETNDALRSLNSTMLRMHQEMNQIMQQSVHLLIKDEVTEILSEITESRIRKRINGALSELEPNELKKESNT